MSYALNSARLNNAPGLADLVDAEVRLRKRDPTRQARLVSGELTEAGFFESLKQEELTPYTE